MGVEGDFKGDTVLYSYLVLEYMNYYKIDIKKPFDYDDPNSKFKKGDVGLYSAKVKEAIKQEAILEVTTPDGVTYVKPRQLIKDKRYIYRYYLKDEPMMLYILTPDYSITKDMFKPKELPALNENGASMLLKAWRDALNKSKCKCT